jgi:hypothetical protein
VSRRRFGRAATAQRGGNGAAAILADREQRERDQDRRWSAWDGAASCSPDGASMLATTLIVVYALSTTRARSQKAPNGADQVQSVGVQDVKQGTRPQRGPNSEPCRRTNAREQHRRRDNDIEQVVGTESGIDAAVEVTSVS